MSSQTIVSNNLFNKKKQFMRLCAIAMVEEGVLKEREQHLLDQIYKEIFKDVDDREIDYTMAIIRSMTMKERENPDIINPSRK